MNHQFRKARYLLISLAIVFMIVSGATVLAESEISDVGVDQADIQTEIVTDSDETQEAESEISDVDADPAEPQADIVTDSAETQDAESEIRDADVDQDAMPTDTATDSDETQEAEPEIRDVDADQDEMPTDAVTDSDGTQEADQIIEGILDEIRELEQLYSEAEEAFLANDYEASEARLRWVIARSVDPDFPTTETDPKSIQERSCEETANVFLFGFLDRPRCQVGLWLSDTLGRSVARVTVMMFIGRPAETFPESFDDDFFIRTELEEEAERAHRVTNDSIKLLEQILIINGDSNKALEIAELNREFEYVRILPLLNSERDLTENVIPERMSIDDIKEIAKEQNSTIVYYSLIADDEIYAWVITPDGRNPTFQVLPIEGVESIAVQAERTRQAASSSVDRGDGGAGVIVWSRGDLRSSDATAAVPSVAEDEQTQALKDLYRSIITPISEYLPTPNDDPMGDSQVVFIPQGPLFGTPFAALQDESGQYLIDQYTIRVAPNLKTLSRSVRTLDEFPKEDDILFVGNPEMPTIQLTENDAPVQLPSLPGAQTEANVIARLFRSEPLAGVVTETTVRQKMAETSVIHLATHGILDSRNLELTKDDLGKIIEDEYGYGERATEYFSKLADDLLPGAIALTPDGVEDGLLRASELLGLEIDAELVVLSACNTARGISGESTILGLPFSLGAAGASRVVVSLWAVPDEPTR